MIVVCVSHFCFSTAERARFKFHQLSSLLKPRQEWLDKEVKQTANCHDIEKNFVQFIAHAHSSFGGSGSGIQWVTKLCI
jgi:hypothetical protein